MNTVFIIKKFFKVFFCAGFFGLAMGSSGFAEPCASSLPFSSALFFDLRANGQMLSLDDCNGDGVADYQTSWTVVEFLAHPLACSDPYDPRHLIVPRSGFYRIAAEPVKVVVLPGRGAGSAPHSSSLQSGGRW